MENKNKHSKSVYSKKMLLSWLSDDPYKEARLIAEVPIKASTLGRIKSGSYTPSNRLANAILNVIKRK